jgi:hypothetical protein
MHNAELLSWLMFPFFCNKYISTVDKLMLKKWGLWGAKPPTPYKKRCGGDSHRRNKIAKKKNLVQVQ